MRPIATNHSIRHLLLAVFLPLAAICSGCASPGNPDPLEKINRFTYGLNDGVDRFALKPVSDGYTKFIPGFIRSGIHNGFDNLLYFNVVVNDFFQGKNAQGWGDAGRMAINSTVGVGGIFDPATGWGLPEHDNDFGITLGKAGCDSGAYLVLPLLGPSSTRDVTSLGIEYACDPLTWLWLPWKITLPLYSTRVIDLRSRGEELARFRSQAAIDPYVFTRDAYLQYREGRIHEGAPPTTQSFYDEDSDSTQPATRESK